MPDSTLDAKGRIRKAKAYRRVYLDCTYPDCGDPQEAFYRPSELKKRIGEEIECETCERPLIIPKVTHE